MTTRWAVRIAVLAAIAALVFGACGGTSPAPPAAGAPGSSAPSAGVDASGGPGPSVPAADPGLAAHHERDLATLERSDAGMAPLVGPNGQAAFDALDAIEAEFGRTLVASAAAIVASGQVPAGADVERAGLVASVDGAPPARRADAGVIDVSLFAETGFTASALMQLFTGLVERAAERNSGTLPHQQPFEETSNGLHQKGVLNSTMSIQTGDGKVHAELTLSATDNITDATTGSFVALYTSTSTGSFDLDACPDAEGIAAGTYVLTTKHELNDVSGAANARSGAGHSTTAPFSLVDGDDAHLVEVRANLDLKADARGPGTAGGPGPTSPFDWTASQPLQVAIPAGGSATFTGGEPAMNGTGGGNASAGMQFMSAIAALFLEEVGKQAEAFWRSGKCIELTPSRDTGTVDPGEQVDLTVTSTAKFGDHAEIKAPIVATFAGKKSLDPHGQPVDPPARFSFEAGPDEGDVGTIDLKQTSRRGIGKRQVVYTVSGKPLLLSLTSKSVADTSPLIVTYRGSVKDLEMTRRGDVYAGKGPITVTIDLQMVADGRRVLRQHLADL